MKKSISVFLMLCLLFSNLSFFVTSADTVYSGYCGAEGDGTNVRWEFDETTGTLSINGTGKMTDWRHSTPYDMYEQIIMGQSPVYSYTPWYEHRDKIIRATISDGITTMGNFTFGSCKNLSEVSLGKDLTNIGVGGFQDCVSLKTLEIPSKVKTLGVGAFFNATSLASVSLPDGLETIYYGVFAQCYALSEVSIPSSVKQINAGAFARAGITSIVLPESISGISSYTFYQCTKLKSVRFLGNIKYINECAFAGCTNSSLIFRIPDTCTTIHEKAFSESRHVLRIICYKGSYGETFCQQNVPQGLYQVTEHAFGLQTVVEPTCAQQGYSLYYCKECDGYKKQDYTEKIAHVMGEWSISAVATETSDGELVCSCLSCDAKEYKSYPYHIPGDTDLDQELTVLDAIVLLQQIAGIKEFDEYALSAGDINLNYSIDIEDATLLLKRLSGSSVDFPSEHPELYQP